MGESFFECPLVWLFAVCVLALVLLARCDVSEEYDPYAWQGGQPEAAEAVSVDSDGNELDVPTIYSNFEAAALVELFKK